MDQALQAVLAVVIPALASLLVKLILEQINKTKIGAAIAQVDKDHKFEAFVEKKAIDVALLVEEHFAAKLKSGVDAGSAKDKTEMFVAEMLAKFPGMTPAEAQKIAQTTLPKVGLGAAKALDGFLQQARSTSSPATL